MLLLVLVGMMVIKVVVTTRTEEKDETGRSMSVGPMLPLLL